MAIKFHPHAKERMKEHRVTEDDIIRTIGREKIKEGEQFLAKIGRLGFRRNFNLKGNRLVRNIKQNR